MVQRDPGVRATLDPRQQAGGAHGSGASPRHRAQAQLHGGGADASLGGHGGGPARLRGEAEAELEGPLNTREAPMPRRGVATSARRRPYFPSSSPVASSASVRSRAAAWRMAMNVASRSSSSLAPACFAPAKRFLLQGSHPAMSAHAYASKVSVFLSSDPGVNLSPANSWRTRTPSIGTSS